jgi:hypothetical protein
MRDAAGWYGSAATACCCRRRTSIASRRAGAGLPNCGVLGPAEAGPGEEDCRDVGIGTPGPCRRSSRRAVATCGRRRRSIRTAFRLGRVPASAPAVANCARPPPPLAMSAGAATVAERNTYAEQGLERLGDGGQHHTRRGMRHARFQCAHRRQLQPPCPGGVLRRRHHALYARVRPPLSMAWVGGMGYTRSHVPSISRTRWPAEVDESVTASAAAGTPGNGTTSM